MTSATDSLNYANENAGIARFSFRVAHSIVYIGHPCEAGNRCDYNLIVCTK